MLKANAGLIKELKKQKRENRFLLFLDNIKIIKDAISHGLIPKLILVNNEMLNQWGDSYPIYKVDNTVIQQLSDSKTPQGVVCIIEYTQNSPKKPRGNYLVLDGLQDPGNVGALIRTACACDYESVFLIESVSINNAKLVRSSVGTIFNIDVFELSRSEFLTLNKEWTLQLIKADMNGENVFDASINSPYGIVVGNEGQGVSKEIGNICIKSVSIPMSKNVESLNAAVSGSIIMYLLNRTLK